MNWYLISFDSARQDVLVEADSPDGAESLVRRIGTQSSTLKEVDEDFEVEETDIQSAEHARSRIKSGSDPFKAYERADDGVTLWEKRANMGGSEGIYYTSMAVDSE